jgi:hypothetical protein
MTATTASPRTATRRPVLSLSPAVRPLGRRHTDRRTPKAVSTRRAMPCAGVSTSYGGATARNLRL